MTVQMIDRARDSVTRFASEDGKTIIATSVDVEPVFDRVKRMREAEINNATLGRCMASIPIAAIQQWGEQFGLTWAEVANDDALLDRCIKDYGKFKVHGGYL